MIHIGWNFKVRSGDKAQCAGCAINCEERVIFASSGIKRVNYRVAYIGIGGGNGGYSGEILVEIHTRGCSTSITGNDWRIGDVCYLQMNGGNRGTRHAARVESLVGKGIGASVICIRSVAKTTIGIERGSAMRSIGNYSSRNTGKGNIVTQHSGGYRHGERGVFRESGIGIINHQRHAGEGR